MFSKRILALAAFLGVLATACGGSASPAAGAKSDYVLYFEGDLTGTSASVGKPILSGFTAYLDYTNKHSGGVKGHKLVLTSLDDGGDPGRVKVNVQQALDGGALVIVGPSNSNGWSPNAPFIQQSQISTIGVGFTDAQVDQPNQYLFGVSPSYASQVQHQIDTISILIKNGTLPAKPRIALYHYTSVAVSTMVNYQKQGFDKNGWTFTTEQTFAVGATDVSSQASAVAAAHPDLVLGEVLDASAPLAVGALRQKGFNGLFLNFSPGSSPATFAALKDPNYLGQVNYLSMKWTDQPGISDIVKRAQEVGDTDSIEAGQWPFGWAIGAAVTSALSKCAVDPCTRAKFNDALINVGKVDANGVSNDLGFTPQNHRLSRSGVYYHWDTSKGKEVPFGSWVPLT